MNNNEKEYIRTMREDGCSYGQIASTLNIKLSTVKNHCLRHGIYPRCDNDDDGENNKHTGVVRNKATSYHYKLCPECQKLFIVNNEHVVKFCSDKCRIYHWRRQKTRQKETEQILQAKKEYLETLQKELDLLDEESNELDWGKLVLPYRRKLTNTG